MLKFIKHNLEGIDGFAQKKITKFLDLNLNYFGRKTNF